MNNTQLQKITLKCTVTGELVTYRGWDYISKRIEKAGSLEILEKTFVCRKGARLQMYAGKFKARSLSNGNKAILPAMTADTPVKPKKVKQTNRVEAECQQYQKLLTVGEKKTLSLFSLPHTPAGVKGYHDIVRCNAS